MDKKTSNQSPVERVFAAVGEVFGQPNEPRMTEAEIDAFIESMKKMWQPKPKVEPK